MRIKTTKNSFTSGELSPLLRGRTDIQQYEDGVERMNNYLIRQQGGISKRPGTRHIGEVLDQTAKLRLQKFVYNVNQGYMLEFSPGKVRVLRDEGFVLEADSTISGATQADPVVVTDNAHGYSDGDVITISSVSGMTELNNKEFKVNNTTTNTYELQDMLGNNIDGTGFSAYISGGVSNRHVVFSTPYTEAELEGLSFAQTNDVLYVASENHKPRKISRTSDTAWTIEEIDNLDGPYALENLTDTTLDPASKTGSNVTMTASASLFASTDVGRIIRLHHTSSSPIAGWCRIISYTSPTEVQVSIASGGFGANTPTEIWRLGAWSETTGYARTVTFHENRLLFGGTLAEPQTIWGSKVDDYENFEPSNPEDLVVADDNGYRFRIASEQNNAIQWLRSSQLLFIGTNGGQYVAKSSGAGITPSDINVVRQNGYGSSIVEPHLISSSLIYCDRSTKKIMQMDYNFDLDNFESKEISVISNHLFREGIRAVYSSYQQTPDNIIWYVMESGTLVGLTYLREQNIIAFHTHNVGGTFEKETITSGYLIEGETYRILSNSGGADFTTVGAPDNNIGTTFVATEINPTYGTGSLALIGGAVIECVATIPSADELTDITYISAKRTINGQTRRYIEYFSEDIFPNHSQDKASMFFVDSGLSYSGVATSTITGLDHLEGETVSVVADNATHPDVVVSNGSITLQEDATDVKVGYGYTATCKLLPIDVQGDIGSSQGSKKRVSKIIIRLWSSLGLQVGENPDSLDEVVFRNSTDRHDLSPPLFTGDKEVLLPMGYNSEGTFYVNNDKPFPANVLFVTPEVRSNL